MTLHITYNHQCPRCGVDYIPYDADVPCPNCGLVAAERFDYVGEAAESSLYNLALFGTFVPPAWGVGSLGDHVLHLLFLILEWHRMAPPGTDFEAVARVAVDTKMDWGDQLYAKEHVFRIACRVYEEIQKRTPVRPASKDEDPVEK